METAQLFEALKAKPQLVTELPSSMEEIIESQEILAEMIDKLDPKSDQKLIETLRTLLILGSRKSIVNEVLLSPEEVQGKFMDALAAKLLEEHGGDTDITKMALIEKMGLMWLNRLVISMANVAKWEDPSRKENILKRVNANISSNDALSSTMDQYDFEFQKYLIDSITEDTIGNDYHLFDRAKYYLYRIENFDPEAADYMVDSWTKIYEKNEIPRTLSYIVAFSQAIKFKTTKESFG